MNEIEICVHTLCLNKATGTDSLSNDNLKKQDVLFILYTLFSNYFDGSILP